MQGLWLAFYQPTASDSEDMERYYRFENYISHTDDEATGWTNQLYRSWRGNGLSVKSVPGWRVFSPKKVDSWI